MKVEHINYRSPPIIILHQIRNLSLRQNEKRYLTVTAGAGKVRGNCKNITYKIFPFGSLLSSRAVTVKRIFSVVCHCRCYILNIIFTIQNLLQWSYHIIDVTCKVGM